MRLTTKRRAIGAALAGFMAVLPLQAADLTITQFRVRGPAGGNDEFVEVQNTGTAALDVSGCKLHASYAAGTLVATVDMLKAAGAKKIKGLFLVAAPEGLKRIEAAHPDIEIYVACIDDHLNELGYILPGLGDAGDKIFGTKQKPS